MKWELRPRPRATSTAHSSTPNFGPAPGTLCSPGASARHFRGGGGSEAHFRPRGSSGGGGGAGGRARAPRDRRRTGGRPGSHGARPRGRGARAGAVSAGPGGRSGPVSAAAVWGAGPGRAAGTARWEAPETPHRWCGRGSEDRGRPAVRRRELLPRRPFPSAHSPGARPPASGSAQPSRGLVPARNLPASAARAPHSPLSGIFLRAGNPEQASRSPLRLQEQPGLVAQPLTYDGHSDLGLRVPHLPQDEVQTTQQAQGRDLTQPWLSGTPVADPSSCHVLP